MKQIKQRTISILFLLALLVSACTNRTSQDTVKQDTSDGVALAGEVTGTALPSDATHTAD